MAAESVTLSPETVEAIKDELRKVRTGLDRVRTATERVRAQASQIRKEYEAGEAYEPLDDETREEIYDRLLALDDDDLVAMLMGLQKIVQARARGHLRELADRETIFVGVALARFAPESFERALGEYLDEQALAEEWAD